MKIRRLFAVAVIFALISASESFADFQEIQFGRYYQNAGEKELLPIEWLILAENDNSLLLLTKHCIDQQPYNDRNTNITWEKCTLRNWLNSYFLDTAFTAQEKSALSSEQVFLLSAEDVEKYIPEISQRQCLPTSYARADGVYVNENGLCAWWTSSQGKTQNQAAYLSSYGEFGRRPHYVDDNVIGVRPAVWVNKKFFAIRP